MSTDQRTFRQMSLEIANVVMQARAKWECESLQEDYNIIDDPEGYLESILIALRHLADEQLKEHPENAEAYEWDKQLDYSYQCYLEDLQEEKRIANSK